jgi:hypothetical protein
MSHHCLSSLQYMTDKIVIFANDVLVIDGIAKVPLESSGRRVPSTSRWSLEELRQTLPQAWSVYETLDGRYIFYDLEHEVTSWLHPDPEILREFYTGYPHITEASHAFEALSYVWEPRKPFTKAYVSPSLSSSHQLRLRRTCKVGRNLADALRHLRYDNQWRALWVDAICINQQDDTERSKQVQ